MRRKISTLMLCTMLASCSMAPDYERPASPVAANWPAGSSAESTADATQPVAAIAWKDFFQSPTLQQLITQALENNRDLRVAALNVEKARAAYRIERAGYFPRIDAAGTESRTATPENANRFGGLFTGGRFVQSNYQANLATTAWELDIFGRVKSLSDAALEDFYAQQSARDATQITLIAETANAYLQWLADEKALQLASETLEAQEKSFSLINQSYEAGVRSKLDMVQARSTVEAARASKAAYTRAVAQDKNALAVLTGAASADAIRTDDTLDGVQLLKTLPVNLPADALLHRPDILQAEHVLKSENANIGAARAAFFPTISLTGSFGFASTELSNLFSSGSGRAWNFSPRISVPIFAGGQNFANLDAAKVSKEIAIANYEKAIQSAFREVADELAARETLGEQFAAQQELVQANQTAYDLSYARYKAGSDSFLNALQSQRELFSAQQNAIDAQRLQLVNLVTLYKVLGGGLQ